MKQRKRLAFVAMTISLLLVLVLCLCSCGKDTPQGEQPQPQPSENGESGGGTIEKPDDPSLKTFEGLVFSEATYNYDGTEKSLEVVGAPEGSTITYENNNHTDAGSYEVKAKVEKDGYNATVLKSTLTINKIPFEGIEFADKTVTYTGETFRLDDAKNIPSYASVNYVGTREGKDAGEYRVTVNVTDKNHIDFTKSAKLTIEKAILGDFTFQNETFEYDEQWHYIEVSGLLPEGEKIVYSGGENGKNGAKSVGERTIVAEIGGKNYVKKTLTADIKIKSTEEELVTAIFNGKVYFENPLDSNKLYCTDGTTVDKVNNDIPSSFVVNGSKMYYLSDNLFGKGIVSYDGENSTDLYEINGKYLVCDGTTLYYSVSNIFNSDDNGIYAIGLSDLENTESDPTAHKICGDKAEYLTVIGNYIYFSNKSDGGKLYRVLKTSNNGTSEKVYDYKVSEIVKDGNKLFFTRHITMSNLTPGACIYSLDTSKIDSLPIADGSKATTKISNSKGKYLTVISDYIYFVNVDMLTSSLFGNGIYKAKIDGSDWKDTIVGGQKLIDGETDNVFALSTDGNKLYYYRSNNKHLYAYDGDREVDLMEGFVAPEKKESITTIYEEMKAYNGELYFIDMKDGGRLHKYNCTTDMNTRITSLQVADFAIHEAYLYYATVRLGTNFDLYRTNLRTGESDRISTDKCMHFAFGDNKIYYANYSGKNTLNSMNFDGTDNKVIFQEEKVNDYDIYLSNGKLYFVANNKLYCYDLSSASSSIVNKDAKPNEYLVLSDGTAYMMNDKFNNYFSKIDLKTSAINDIADLGKTNDARSFFVVGNYIYYYRNVAAGSAQKGLYRVDMTATTLTAEKVTALDGYNMACAVVLDGKVYFIDAWQIVNSLPTSSSTGKLCSLDLDTLEVKVID